MVDSPTKHSIRPSWGWYLFVPLLSLQIYWPITDLFSLSIVCFVFLPVVAAFLAHRHGTGVVTWLLTVALFAAFNPAFTFEFMDYVDIELDVPIHILLLSIAAAIAFSDPRFGRPERSLVRPRWSKLKWLLVPALIMTLLARWAPDWELGDEYLVGLDVGIALAIVVLAASVNFGALRDEVARLLGAANKPLPMLLFAIFVLSLIFFAEAEISDEFLLRFGDSTLRPSVFVLAFALPAFGVVGWRIMVVALLAFYALDWLYGWIEDAIVSMLENDEEVVFDEIERVIVTGSRIATGPSLSIPSGLLPAVSATLLGAAIEPYWRHKDAALVRNGRSSTFLFLSFALVLVGVALDVGGYWTLLLCGCAFMIGLTWQIRGLISGPLIILIGYLLALVLTFGGYYATARVYYLVSIGFVVLPFALIGLLAGRPAISIGRGESS